MFFVSFGCKFQHKRRLRKELTDRDQVIEKLTIANEEIREANAVLQLRVEHFDKQLQNMEQRSLSHLQVIEEQQRVVEEKIAQLRSMEVTNKELESYLNEIRRSKGGGEVDASFECVDSSFVSGTGGGPSTDQNSSSDSPGSPQSLAQTVIDVQLREEQVRNQQLCNQLEVERREKIAKVEELRNELLEVQAMNQSLRTTCQLEHMQKLIDLANAMRTQQNEYEEANSVKILEQEYLRTENTELLDQVTRLNSVNQDLLQQITMKEIELDGLGKENNDLVQERQQLQAEKDSLNEMVAKLEASMHEHQRVQKALEAEEVRLQECMLTLNTQVDMLTIAKSELSADKSKQHKKIGEVQQSMRVLADKFAHVENKYDEIRTEREQLSKSKDELQQALDSAQAVQTRLETEMSNLKTINEDQIQLIGGLQVQCLQLNEQLMLAKQSTLRLENENNSLKSSQEDILEHTQRLKDAEKIFIENAGKMSQTISELKTNNEVLRKQVCDKLAQLQLVASNKEELFEKLETVKQQLEDAKLQITNNDIGRQEAYALCDTLTEERKQLLDRISTMGKSLIDQRTEFEEQNEALNLEIVNNQQALVEMRGEFEAIKQQLLDDCQEIEQLKESKQILAAKVEEKEGECSALKANLDTVQGDKDKLLLDVETSRSELEEVIEKLQCLEDTKRTLENDLSAKANALTRIEAELIEAQSEQNSTHLANAAILQTKLSEFSDKCKLLEASLQEKSMELKVLNEEKHILQTELHLTTSELSIKNEELLTSRAEHQISHDSLSSKLREIEQEHQQFVQNSDEEKQRLVSRIEDLMNQLETCQNYVDKLNAQIRRQEDNILGLETEREGTQKRIAEATKDLQARLGEKEIECSSNWRTVNDLMKTVETLEMKIKEKTAEQVDTISMAEENRAGLQQQLQSAQDDCVQLTNELNEMTKTLDTLTTDRNDVKAKLDEQDSYYRSNVDKLQLILQETNDEHNILKTQVGLLQTAQQDLHRNMEEKDKALLAESIKFATLQKEHDEITASYQQLQVSLKELMQNSDKKVEEFNILQEENTKVLADLSKTTEEVTYLRAEKDELTQLLATCNMQCAKHKKAIEDNYTALANSQQDLLEAKLQFDEVTQKLVEANDENGKLIATHDLITTEQEHSKHQSQSLTEQLSAVMSKYNELLAEQSQRIATISQLTERQKELEESNSKLQEQLAESQSQAKSQHSAVIASARQLELEIADMKTQMTVIEVERDQLLAQIKDISEDSSENILKLADLTTEYTKQNKQLLQQTQLITDKSTEIQTLRQHLDEQSKCNDQKYEELQAKYESAQAVASDLDNQLKQSKETAANISNQLAESRKEVVGITKEIKTITKTMDRLEAEKQELALQISCSKAKCEELGDNKLSIVENMATFVERIKLLETEKEALARDVIVAMSFRERLTELEREVVERTTANQALEQKLSELCALIGFEGSPSICDVVQEVMRLQDHHQNELLIKENSVQAERDYSAKLSTELEILKLQKRSSGEEANVTIAQLKSECEELMRVSDENSKSIAIFRAKLMKERENSAAAEKAWAAERARHESEQKASEIRVTETRSELEGKLEKMKCRMVSCFFLLIFMILFLIWIGKCIVCF